MASFSTTAADSAAFLRDGVCVIRQAFDPHWVGELRQAIARLRDPSAARRPEAMPMNVPEGPQFFIDQFRWRDDPGLEAFVRESPAAEIAGGLMSASEIRFFYDQLFVKDPGAAAPTPWHQDLSYWPVSGEQVVSLWVALDSVDATNGALQYVKGSHRWPELYRAVNFLPDLLPDAMFEERFGGITGEAPPNVDARRGEFDLATWTLAPGDCVAHHPRTLHGAPGNFSAQSRRGYATRWLGDDVRWDVRPGTMPAPDVTKTGDRPAGDFYPLVWTAH